MKIYSFTFARSGSKGIKNKNLKIFNKKPLVCWAIKNSIDSKIISKTFISTDSKKIAKLSKNEGAIIPFLRPKRLSTDKSPEWLSWKHAINYLKKKNDIPEIFVSVPCTAPLRKSSDLDTIIKKLTKIKNADAVVGITYSDRNPYFNMVKMNSNGKLSILMKSNKNFSRRQDCPMVFDLTTFAFAIKTKFLLKAKNLFSGNVYGHIVDKKRSIDIDNILELKIAEFLKKVI
jgi:CMP-N-acetylneuraminic acid synthetase